jgi:DNA-directed RNA polymerase
MTLRDDEASAKLPQLPAKGDFKVEKVIDSAYFFC